MSDEMVFRPSLKVDGPAQPVAERDEVRREVRKQAHRAGRIRRTLQARRVGKSARLAAKGMRRQALKRLVPFGVGGAGAIIGVVAIFALLRAVTGRTASNLSNNMRTAILGKEGRKSLAHIKAKDVLMQNELLMRMYGSGQVPREQIEQLMKAHTEIYDREIAGLWTLEDDSNLQTESVLEAVVRTMGDGIAKKIGPSWRKLKTTLSESVGAAGGNR